jgi:hypothetical protein
LAASPWSVRVQRLEGGRRQGVELIEVDTGLLRFDVLPTRGMGIWQAHCGGHRIGWRSPVQDGPVHPSLVPLEAWGGLGWLEGFDELFARCGLEWNGPPYRDGDRTYSLHGRIANIPAHDVALEFDDKPPYAITIEGIVDETRLFGAQLEMRSRISAVPGTTRLTVRDQITNRKSQPSGFQLLNHWNLGPPLLEQGSRLVAPVKLLCPRTADAAEVLDRFDIYEAPRPGAPELVYFFELWGTGARDETVVMLKNRASDLAVSLRFSLREQPRFIVWKNHAGTNDGYVTGLEPAVNYPNPRPYETSQGRVIPLAPGESYDVETTFEIHLGKDTVVAVEREIDALRRQGQPVIHPAPLEPYVVP